MAKHEDKGSLLITLPKDIRAIRPYIAHLFDSSILYNEQAFIYDLVAVLAWRANTERGRMSNRLKGSKAHRFVESIDDAIVRWENEKRKISPTLRIFLYSSLFESVSERAHHFMKRGELVGLNESLY